MTRLWSEGSPIAVKMGGSDSPESFTWQGQVHRIQHIWQHWQVDSDWWTEQGRAWRDVLAVSTTDGLLCVLYYDVQKQEWFLERLYD